MQWSRRVGGDVEVIRRVLPGCEFSMTIRPGVRTRALLLFVCLGGPVLYYAGALYSDAAGKFAVLAKTTRNATIGFVVLGYALYWVRRDQAREIAHKGAFLWEKFPKFVIGFLAASALVTILKKAISLSTM